jgi:hypothetical protein
MNFRKKTNVLLIWLDQIAKSGALERGLIVGCLNQDVIQSLQILMELMRMEKGILRLIKFIQNTETKNTESKSLISNCLETYLMVSYKNTNNAFISCKTKKHPLKALHPSSLKPPF